MVVALSREWFLLLCEWTLQFILRFGVHAHLEVERASQGIWPKSQLG